MSTTCDSTSFFSGGTCVYQVLAEKNIYKGKRVIDNWVHTKIEHRKKKKKKRTLGTKTVPKLGADFRLSWESENGAKNKTLAHRALSADKNKAGVWVRIWKRASVNLPSRRGSRSSFPLSPNIRTQNFSQA